MSLDSGLSSLIFQAFPLLSAMIVVSLAGGAIVDRLTPETSWTLRLGWGWVIGSGLTTFFGFILALAGLPYQAGAAVLLVVAVLSLKSRRTVSMPKHSVLPVARVLLAFIFIGLLSLAVSTVVPGWDGLAIWGVKARWILTEGQMPFHAMAHPLAGPAHPEYPLHVPLRAALLAWPVGGWSEMIMPLASTMDLLSIFLLLLGVLERAGGSQRWRTAFFLAATLLPMPFAQISRGYADLTVGAAILGLVVAIGSWLEGRVGKGVAVIGLLCALTAHWAKQEGLMYVLVVGACAWALAPAFARSRKALCGAGAVVLLTAVPWQIVRFREGFYLEDFGLRSPDLFDRLPTIISSLVHTVADWEQWGGLWPAVLVVLAARLFQLGTKRNGFVLADLSGSFLLLAAAAIVAVFMATPRNLEWHLATSLDRLMLQLAPTAMCFLFMVIFPARERSESARG